ncbi:lipoprotein, putative [Xanthomonas oryzae pv. oryzae PXO99A]|nr:lipoprotein, putative [Xanthomonas oryzae pv. oryzae PXO99A]
MRRFAVVMTLGVLVACSAQQAPTQAATPAPVACTDPKVEDE